VFTSALDASVVQLLNTAGETGTWPSAAQRTTILVLPKNDEALQVKHDSGELPESFDEGYEIKADKVRDTLRRIGRDGLPVVMYNSETDDSDGLASVLLQRVEGVRAAHVKRIEETVRAIDGLAAEAYRAGVAQVHAAVYDQLRGVSATKLRAPAVRPFEKLIAAIRNLHPRTVWASIVRQGHGSISMCTTTWGLGLRWTRKSGPSYRCSN